MPWLNSGARKMRSTAKTVLFARAKVAGKVTQHPVAVFPNDAKCRAGAVEILNAHRAANADALKGLNVAWLVHDDGSLAGDLKFSRIELPYDPAPAAPAVDPFGDDSSATS